MKELFAKLIAMGDVERQELLHMVKESGVPVTARAPKKEKVAVAYRVQTKDTAPNARRPRKAGDVYPMTAKSLEMTIKTWVRGKKNEDVSALQDLKIKSVLDGNKESFATFDIVGASTYEKENPSVLETVVA